MELAASLNLSRQIIHRYLKQLVAQQMLEVRGSMPVTHYVLAGTPDLNDVIAWLKKRPMTTNPPTVCESREVFAARLPRLVGLVKSGLSPAELPLVISSVGEIGNNSFDHNIGQWQDVPGCWFEYQVTGSYCWLWVADRGQGIFQSLARVHRNLKNDQAALKAAFETIISGRAPEKRGNGLKYVRENILSTKGGGLACLSGTGHVNYGDEGKACLDYLTKNLMEVKGTITLVAWRRK